MSLLWIISTSLENIKAEGYFYWRNQYLEEIAPYIQIQHGEYTSITKAIIYFNKAKCKEKKVLEAEILFVSYTKYCLKLHYKICKESHLHSYQIKQGLKIYLNKSSIVEIPYCTTVKDEDFYRIIDSTAYIYELENYCEKKQWEKAYAAASKNKPWEKSIVWNSPEHLRIISFITAKLSEATVKLKKIYSDNKERIKYIAEKKKYRMETILLRERLIEIDANNASNYSALAYTYYLSVFELSIPGGRRDGDIIKDADWSVYYFDKALDIDSNRISDYYRKGQLLLRILPKYLLYTNVDASTLNQRYLKARQYMNIGIETLEKGVKKYEQIVGNEFWKKHWKKYYVKSLYNLAYGKFSLGRVRVKIKDNEIICTEDNNIYKKRMLEDGIKYIDKCIEADSIKSGEISEIVEHNNFICGVYKTYLKGVLNLQLYIQTRNVEYKQEAWEYLHRANEVRFPMNFQRQSKIFVLEKLAFYNLFEKKYKNAIILLEKGYIIGKNIPEYVLYTLAIGYLLNGDRGSALKITEGVLKNPKSIMLKKFEDLYEYATGKKTKIEWIQEDFEEVEQEQGQEILLEPQ